MRLIDADILIEMLRHDIDCYDTGKPEDKIYINAKDVKNMIDGQPTAYNLDKVVEQLRGLNENEFTYAGVMHIVKAGEVNG